MKQIYGHSIGLNLNKGMFETSGSRDSVEGKYQRSFTHYDVICVSSHQLTGYSELTLSRFNWSKGK